MKAIFILNVIGLSLGFIGALVIFVNSPKIDYRVFVPNFDDDQKIAKKAKFKNRINRLGMLLISIAFVLQLVAMIFSK